MDLQKLVNSIAEQSARDKSKYHLTFGDFIDALKNADKTAEIDSRILGIGSYRGSYIEIALFTESSGCYTEKSEFMGRYEDYDSWAIDNVVEKSSLPRNANELGDFLESILGLYFVGYKGGHYEIERWKPLWLCTEGSSADEVAVIGIDKDLTLVTKEM